MTDQAEAGDAKEGMKDVDDEAGTGGDAARGGILSIVPQRAIQAGGGSGVSAHLGVQDKGLQAMAIDPMRSADHGQATDDPPAIADVLELLGPTVEATASELALAQPSTDPVGIDQVATAGDAEGAQAGEGLAGVRLRPRRDAVAAVDVGAGLHVADRGRHVHHRPQPQQREGVEGSVQEACVGLAPLIAGNGAGGGILPIPDI